MLVSILKNRIWWYNFIRYMVRMEYNMEFWEFCNRIMKEALERIEYSYKKIKRKN